MVQCVTRRATPRKAERELRAGQVTEKTFKLRLVPASPGVRADRLGFNPRADARWSGLEPLTLAEAEAS